MASCAPRAHHTFPQHIFWLHCAPTTHRTITQHTYWFHCANTYHYTAHLLISLCPRNSVPLHSTLTDFTVLHTVPLHSTLTDFTVPTHTITQHAYWFRSWFLRTPADRSRCRNQWSHCTPRRWDTGSWHTRSHCLKHIHMTHPLTSCETQPHDTPVNIVWNTATWHTR